ncbi:MAG: hypothetical protein Q8S03_15110 [Brevundimonas sp.]|uniref:hypothetical protein n=1 Tax=Brevundimonas sp. TaxID=1871086 RepID=UPI0027374D88|nr:hypothetical protein [Brevundimonas sp.]MDP3406018.1 hypothetical protein [Brevundimonas sp.]
MRLPVSMILVGLLVSTAASAQEAPADWDLLVDPAKKLTMAYTDFNNGLSLAVRCVDGGYEAIIAGLPPAADLDRRPLTIQFGDDQPAPTQWNVAMDPAIAVSERPAPFARDLREGGRLQIVAPGAAEGGRNLRYVLDLPVSGASIDRTLEACDKPLVDPRDAELAALGDTGLPGGVNWASLPRPSFPSPAVYQAGFAVISCLTEPDGRLRACEVETEHPRDGGFGAAALRATRRARLEDSNAPGAALPLRRILYRTQFRLETESESLVPPSRLRRNLPPSLSRRE